nr:MAG TPA: hypothetical protein [Caudoviricetes sp.]
MGTDYIITSNEGRALPWLALPCTLLASDGMFPSLY